MVERFEAGSSAIAEGHLVVVGKASGTGVEVSVLVEAGGLLPDVIAMPLDDLAAAEGSVHTAASSAGRCRTRRPDGVNTAESTCRSPRRSRCCTGGRDANRRDSGRCNRSA